MLNPAWCLLGMTGRNTDHAQGIFRCRFADGQMSGLELAAAIQKPGFLAIHPNGRVIASTTGDGVATFALDPNSAALKLISTISMGDPTCHVRFDATGRVLLAACYKSGWQTSFHVLDDGLLQGPVSLIQNHGRSVNPKRQNSPHAHSFNPDPSNQFALSCDLGIDQVLIFRMDTQSAKLTAHDAVAVPAGNGPRHLAFSGDGRFAFIGNELSNTLTVMSWDSTSGKLQLRADVSTLPPGLDQTSHVAEVCLHPSGQFLYVSNRGHDSIALFGFDAPSGAVRLLGHTPSGGREPRHLQFTPNGRHLIASHEQSGDVTVFQVDPATGQLHPLPGKVQIPSASCVQFLPVQTG